jgi:hypothetical protein
LEKKKGAIERWLLFSTVSQQTLNFCGTLHGSIAR